MSCSLKISRDDDGRRLDRFLRGKFKHITLGEIMKSIRLGEVRINSKKIKEPGERIYEGDELTVKWPLKNDSKFSTETSKKYSSWGKIKIIFQGENVLILNKPSGILVQPDEAGGDSVISRVWSVTGLKSAAAVHRLDRNTTGILIVALNGKSLRALEEVFKIRNVRKFYRAIVAGIPPEKITIEAPLLKDAEKNLVKVSDSGLKAVTICKTLAASDDKKISLVELELQTGRTHQARVHMSHIKHPILGDRKYGDFEINKLMKNIKRPMLHAYELEFPTLSDESLKEISGKKFFAPLPEDMKEILELRINKYEN